MSKKIDQIVFHQFKKHRELKIDLNGNHFLVVGKNGVGKSSVLDAVIRLIGVRSKEDKIQEPVTTGEAEGRTGIYINDNGAKYYVEETFKKGKASSLSFYRVDGRFKDAITPALERLKQVVGVQVDFSKLMDMSGADQFEFFKSYLGDSEALTLWSHDYNNIFDSRKLVNREVTTMRSKLDAPELRVFEADKEMYKEEKSAAELMEKKIKLQPLYNEKQEILNKNATRVKAMERHGEIENEIKELETKIQALREKQDIARYFLAKNPWIDPIDIDNKLIEATDHNLKIDAEIQQVSDWNANVVKVRNYIEDEAAYNGKMQRSADMTKELNGMKSWLKDQIATIGIEKVVPGLSLEHEVEEVDGKMKVVKSGLYLDGLPFHEKQQSQGKMIKAIILLSSYFNADKLNFIPIHNWSLLDKDNQKEILDFVHANKDLNVQLGIEKVDENEEIVTEIIQA